MMNALDLNESKELSNTIKNPFFKDKIQRLSISMQKTLFYDSYTYYGIVEFKNDNTKGEQSFDGESFDEIVLKVKEFIEKELT